MKYVNQAPKELKAQSAKFKKKWPTLEQLVLGGWIVQKKYDGVHAMIHTEGDGYARTRTGEPILSIAHIVAECVDLFGPGWVIFAEVWKAGLPHQEINGAVRRHAMQPHMGAVLYDMVSQAEFDAGYSPDTYLTRYGDLCAVMQAEEPKHLELVECMNMGHELFGTDLNELALNLQNDTADAYDGLILRDPSAAWTAGAAKEGEVIKVKPTLSLDLRVVGHQVEQRATKLGGYFTVEYNGVQSDVGSGLTQAMLQGLTLGAYHIGKIVEVECLGLTPDGKLREPRFKSFRFDTVQEELKD